MTMKTKNVVYLLLCILVIGFNFQSCFFHRVPVDIKWNGENNRISSLVDNAGYYKMPVGSAAFVFYDDGTLVKSSRVPNDPDALHVGSWPPGCYYENELDRWEGGASGLYRIEGDTIFANLYFRNGFYFSLKFQIKFITDLWKLKFRIIDRNTIVLCEEQEIDKGHQWEYPPLMKNDTLHFWEASQLPPPNTEFKNKRRFWEKSKQKKKQ